MEGSSTYVHSRYSCRPCTEMKNAFVDHGRIVSGPLAGFYGNVSEFLLYLGNVFFDLLLILFVAFFHTLFYIMHFALCTLLNALCAVLHFFMVFFGYINTNLKILIYIFKYIKKYPHDAPSFSNIY